MDNILNLLSGFTQYVCVGRGVHGPLSSGYFVLLWTDDGSEGYFCK